MPNTNVQFQGQTLPIPGSYYADDVSAALPANPALIPPLVFIGYGYGPKPKTPTSFPNGGGQPLLNALRGGPAASFVPFIANPSTVLFGASQIVFIDASQNTQSTLTLNSTSSAPMVTLTSTFYGPPSNLLQAQVEPGTEAGVAITLFDGYTGTNSIAVDNLGVPFQLAYTGSASGVAYSVTTAAGEGATNLVITSPHPGESVTLPLGTSQYDTIASIVNYLNSTGFYAAQVLPNIANSNVPSNALDLATNVSLPAPISGTDQFVNVNAMTGSIIYWANAFAAANFATAALASGAVANVFATPASIAFTHFSGATAVAPTLSDYAAAFTAAQSVAAWVVIADSNDAAVQALGAQHAFDMSQPNIGKWRRFVTGSSIGEGVPTAQQNARDLNAFMATYCYPGIYRTDTNTGVNTLYDGLHVAAAVASMMAGNIVAQPLTMQSLVGNGVEVALTVGAGGQVDLLQQAGVLPVYMSPVTNVPTIVSDLTTWQLDNNPENVFNQQVACRFALAYSLSQGLQPYVGTIASTAGLTRIKNAAKNILNSLIYSPGNNGILNSWDATSLVITYTGSTQTVNLTVNVTFVGQVRFILELAFVQPLNLTA